MARLGLREDPYLNFAQNTGSLSVEEIVQSFHSLTPRIGRESGILAPGGLKSPCLRLNLASILVQIPWFQGVKRVAFDRF